MQAGIPLGWVSGNPTSLPPSLPDMNVQRLYRDGYTGVEHKRELQLHTAISLFYLLFGII